MTKIRNAAIILLGIGEKYAADILKHMSPTEIQAIIEEINQIENVDEADIIKAMNDFFKDANSNSGIDLVSKESLKNSLTTAAEFGILGSDGTDTSETMTKWLEIFKWQPVENIVSVIRDEHPQVIAVIITTMLNGEKASKVIKSMPKPLQSQIVYRMSSMGPISTFAMDTLVKFYEHEFNKNDKYNSISVDGVEAVANIISYLDTDTEAELLGSLTSSDQSLTEKIQDRAFPFERLTKLDSKSLQTLLKEVSNDDLVIALKGSDDFVKATFMKNMSTKSAEILKDELETKGPVKVTSVIEAQKRIIALAKSLAAEEKIILTTKSDSGVIY